MAARRRNDGIFFEFARIADRVADNPLDVGTHGIVMPLDDIRALKPPAKPLQLGYLRQLGLPMR